MIRKNKIKKGMRIAIERERERERERETINLQRRIKRKPIFVYRNGRGRRRKLIKEVEGKRR